jgi:hypothetical protein
MLPSLFATSAVSPAATGPVAVALPLAGPWGLAVLIFLLLAVAGLYLVIRNPK